MINLNHYGSFIMHQMCFIGAAHKPYITQSAVAAHVKSFENFCNLKLFKDKGRIVYLADEGKTLYDYAAKIFKREKEIESWNTNFLRDTNVSLMS